MIDSVNPESEAGGATASAADLKKARRRKALTEVAAVLVPDRLPPHSTEAEQGVLGCILLDPPHCLGECIEKCKSGAEVFYELKHQVIYEALVAMSAQTAPRTIWRSIGSLRNSNEHCRTAARPASVTTGSCECRRRLREPGAHRAPRNQR